MISKKRQSAVLAGECCLSSFATFLAFAFADQRVVLWMQDAVYAEIYIKFRPIEVTF